MQEEKVTRRIHRLNAKLTNLHHHILSFPVEAHTYQPGTGIWSPLQVCKHLQLSESLSLKNLEYNLGRIETRPNATPKSNFNLFLMKMALISPLKYKAPATVTHEGPPASLDAGAVFRAWFSVREKLEERFHAFPQEAFSKQVFKHPYAGYLTAYQMLRFFAYHFDHHARQINRRLRRWEQTQME